MTAKKVKGADKRELIYKGLAGRVAQLVDYGVGLVAPSVAHKMRCSRMKSRALLAAEAAEIDRTMPAPRSRSADAEALEDGETLRARARNLTRDDAHCESIALLNEENVVGGGIRPQSACTPESTGMTAEQCDAWREQCEAFFEEWAENEADATGQATFWDLQGLVARTRKVDGECFAHTVIDGKNISVELIDSDRVKSPNDLDSDTMRGGVKMGTGMRPQSYYVLRKHPDDIGFGGAKLDDYDVIPRTDGDFSIVQHVFRRKRPGQSRGIPDLTPALPYMSHLHHYLNSELIAARASSSYAMFIKRSADATDASIYPVQESESSAGADYHETIDPGTIAYLNDGEEPVSYTPNRPGSAFEPFVMRVLRAVATSQGISYEQLARDYGGMNYSSMRGVLLEARRGYDKDRALLNRQFNTPTYRNVVRIGIMRGRLTPPPRYGDNPEPFLAVRWIAPPYGWVDPTKEIQAAKDAIEANLSTPYEEGARAGHDPEMVLRARGRFLARAGEIENEYRLPPGSLSNLEALPPEAAETSTESDGESRDETREEDGGDASSTATDAKKATKERLDALGLAVRAGILSPSLEVEETLRSEFALPPMNPQVAESWEINPVRRPVTIAGKTEDPPVPTEENENEEEEPAPQTGEDPFAQDEDEPEPEPDDEPEEVEE